MLAARANAGAEKYCIAPKTVKLPGLWPAFLRLIFITLGEPTELWFDVQPANQAQRFCRVVPAPITIP